MSEVDGLAAFKKEKTQEYYDNYDRIFRKDKDEDTDTDADKGSDIHQDSAGS